MKFVLLGLLVFQTCLQNTLSGILNGKELDDPYKSDKNDYAPKNRYLNDRYSNPKITWNYWINDITFNKNQQCEPTDFATVDCNLSPNIIFFDFENINFSDDLVYDWMTPSLGETYLRKLYSVKKRCPHVKIAIDHQFAWDKTLADQIGIKFSIKQLVEALVNFNIKYYFDATVIYFKPEAVLNDKLTYDFLKELKHALSNSNMELLLIYGYGFSSDLTYIRPVAFEFADEILLYLTNFSTENRNTFEHINPAFGNDYRNVNNFIDLFLAMGAPRSKISLELDNYGMSFKRIPCTPQTEPGCPADGLGSSIYSEMILEVNSKIPWPFVHDRDTLCRMIDDPTWTKKFDDEAQVPYAFNSEQWMSYENEKSLKIKTDLVKNKQIGGVFIYALNFDDTLGQCGKGSFPMTKFITKQFERSLYPSY